MNMPTYEDLAGLLRQLVKSVHATLGQEDLQLTRETSGLMVAMKEATDALSLLRPPQQPAESDDSSVINLGPATVSGD